MIEINKEFLVKNWSKIAVVVLLILLTIKCNENNNNVLKAKFQKQEAEKNLQNANLFEQKNNYLQEKESKYLDTIALLETKNKDVVYKIIEIKEKGKTEIEKIKKFKSSEIAEYIKTRYKTDQNNAYTIDKGTVLSDTIAKKVIIEITEGDTCSEEVYGLNEIIFNNKEIINQKDNIILNSKEQNTNLSSAIDQYKIANELKSNALKNTEKAFKKERNKKNIYKITTILTILGGGYLLVK